MNFEIRKEEQDYFDILVYITSTRLLKMETHGYVSDVLLLIRPKVPYLKKETHNNMDIAYAKRTN
jgi:hypothetical protein